MLWKAQYEADASRLAWAALPLLLDPSDWIQRRVEGITITSRRLVRRSVSVDLALPAEADREDLKLDPASADSPMIVPLGLLRKEQLIDFDLQEGSQPLMLVRSGLNSLLSAAIIGNVADFEGRTPVEIKAAQDWLVRIAGPDTEVADQAFRELMEGAPDVPVPARALAAGEATVSVADQLRESYVLFIELPENGERRRLVRFATDQVLGEESWPVRQRLGLDPIPVDLPIPGASQTASYHAEIEVPGGCLVKEASVVDGDQAIVAGVHKIGERATIYPTLPLTENAQLQLTLVADRGFFFLPAAIISTLVAALIGAGTLLAWLDAKPLATASAILLSGLGALTGLVLQRDETHLTRELYGLARGLLVAVTASALVSAAAIAFGAKGDPLALWWSGACLVSVLCAITLLFSAKRSATVRSVSGPAT